MRRLIDLWIGRHAETSPDGIQTMAGLRPATVVTGGSRGIGFALARRFARAGQDVAIVARHPEALRSAAEAIQREQKVAAVPIALDVAAADAMQVIEAELRARRSPLITLRYWIFSAYLTIRSMVGVNSQASVFRALQ